MTSNSDNENLQSGSDATIKNNGTIDFDEDASHFEPIAKNIEVVEENGSEINTQITDSHSNENLVSSHYMSKKADEFFPDEDNIKQSSIEKNVANELSSNQSDFKGDENITNKSTENVNQIQEKEFSKLEDSQEQKSIFNKIQNNNKGSEEVQLINNNADIVIKNDGNDNNNNNNDDDDYVNENGSDDDDEIEEETNSQEESDDEDDEPPKLKYTRLTELPASFFKKDPVSACLIHENFFAFATHSGVLHLTTPDFKPIKTFRAHQASILSVFSNGEYFATASMDGTVVIGSLKDESDITRFDFKRPVHCVVIDKDYKQSRWFALGGMAGKVIFSQKNWLNNRNDTILEEGHGPIVGMYNIGEILIWANDLGLSFFNVMTKSKILNIPRPSNSPRSDLYWPRFHSSDKDRLTISWCDYIYNLKIEVTTHSTDVLSSRSSIFSSAASTFRVQSERKIEVENTLHLDSLISGAVSFNNGLLLVLTFEKNHNPPEIRLLNCEDGEEVADDQIALQDYKNLGLNDYHLEKYTGENSPSKYFLISAKDAIIVEEFNIQDRLNWYISKQRFEEAWKMSAFIIGKYERINIGLKGVDQFMIAELWPMAAEFLSKVLNVKSDRNELNEGDNSITNFDDASIDIASGKTNSSSNSGDSHKSQSLQLFITDTWNKYLFKLIDDDKIPFIIDYMPIDSSLKIDHEIYEKILIFYLETDKPKYLKLISEWDMKLYDINHIIRLLEERIEVHNDDKEVRQNLITLYLENNDAISAIKHLIILRDKKLILVLTKFRLLLRFMDQLNVIVDIGEHEQTIDMMISNMYQVPPNALIEELLKFGDRYDYTIYLYLEKLFKLENVDPVLLQKFEDLMIRLISKYNAKKLLSFLINNSHYDINKAIELFEKDDAFIKEQIYLLGKIGHDKQALKLIIEKVGDPDEAINFVKIKKNKNKELLKYLVDYSINKPVFITALIETGNELINSIDLIKKIPNESIIGNLKSHLINIMLNNDMNLLLNENILKAINNQTINSANRYIQLNEKGIIQ